MAELENKKFVYKKDRMDKVMVGIVIFTLFCFGLIFYGLDYFNSNTNVRDVDQNRGDINELVNNKDELERRLREYSEQQNFENN